MSPIWCAVAALAVVADPPLVPEEPVPFLLFEMQLRAEFIRAGLRHLEMIDQVIERTRTKARRFPNQAKVYEARIKEWERLKQKESDMIGKSAAGVLDSLRLLTKVYLKRWGLLAFLPAGWAGT